MLKHITACVFFLSFQIGYGQLDSLEKPIEISLLYDLYLERGLILNKEGLTFTYKDTRFRIWEMKRVSFYNTKFIPRAELDQKVLVKLSGFMDSLECFKELRDIPRPETMGRTTLYIKIDGPCLKKTRAIKHGSYYSVFNAESDFLLYYQEEIDVYNALVEHMNALVPDKYGAIIGPPMPIVD